MQCFYEPIKGHYSIIGNGLLWYLLLFFPLFWALVPLCCLNVSPTYSPYVLSSSKFGVDRNLCQSPTLQPIGLVQKLSFGMPVITRTLQSPPFKNVNFLNSLEYKVFKNSLAFLLNALQTSWVASPLYGYMQSAHWSFIGGSVWKIRWLSFAAQRDEQVLGLQISSVLVIIWTFEGIWRA